VTRLYRRHPPATRLAAAPVAHDSSAASAGIYAPSVDGRLWNRRLQPTPECITFAKGRGGEEPGAAGTCGARGRPIRTWVWIDLGMPKAAAGPGRPLSCAPVAVLSSSRLAALVRLSFLAHSLT